MKFYIASKLENAENVTKLANVLKAYGWVHTYDWTIHGSVQNEGEDRIREVAEKEIQGIVDADVIIVLLPGGRGTHAELGAANILGKKVFIYAKNPDLFQHDERTCAFYWNSNAAQVVGEWTDLLAKLFEWAQAKVRTCRQY